MPNDPNTLLALARRAAERMRRNPHSYRSSDVDVLLDAFCELDEALTNQGAELPDEWQPEYEEDDGDEDEEDED